MLRLHSGKAHLLLRLDRYPEHSLHIHIRFVAEDACCFAGTTTADGTASGIAEGGIGDGLDAGAAVALGERDDIDVRVFKAGEVVIE